MKKPEYRIGIIGCGKMGNDLFNYLSGYAFHITWVCKTETQAEALQSSFGNKQKRALKYQLIDQEMFDFRMTNTTVTTNLQQLVSCEFVIESITENLPMKRALFNQIEPVLSLSCIIASNTSSIVPEALFSDMKVPERCLSLHFFFPAGMKDIAELNITRRTAESTTGRVKGFLDRIGKFYIILEDKNHFIINRIFLKMQAACCRMVRAGLADVQQVDALVKANLFPAGVFEFFDHVGNDVMLQSVRNYLRYEANPDYYGDMLYMLEEKVEAGKLGLKANAGFYQYPANNATMHESPVNSESLLEEITNCYLDGVFNAHEKAGLSKNTVEHIVKEYLLVEKSPFDLADETGYTHE